MHKKILIIYYSRSGNTKEMAEMIAKGVEETKIKVECKNVTNTIADELLEADGIIIGSPTYYGTMAWQIKKLLDESVRFHGRLDGKVGAAFSSAGNVGGGNETTVMDIVKALLIHGMVVYGDPQGDHYGPVSIKKPDERVKKICTRLGRRVADLVNRLN